MIHANVVTDSGQPADITEAVVPICRVGDDGLVELLATAFFISVNGIFLTAKHVMSDEDPLGFFIAHNQAQSLAMRPVAEFCGHPTADLAVGIVPNLIVDGLVRENKALPLASDFPPPGAEVATCAYPESARRFPQTAPGALQARWYGGSVVEHFLDGRDGVMLPGPCIRTTVPILPGASGGPVIYDGAVFGLNSTSYGDSVDDADPVSFVSLLLNLVQGLSLPRSLGTTVGDLIQRNIIGVRR